MYAEVGWYSFEAVYLRQIIEQLETSVLSHFYAL